VLFCRERGNGTIRAGKGCAGVLVNKPIKSPEKKDVITGSGTIFGCLSDRHITATVSRIDVS
jgi:hypothetical protein